MSLLDLFTHKYPSTDFHELNLDWCISAILELQKVMQDFTAGNKLILAQPLQHDLSKTYAKNTIVIASDGNAYLSLQPVSAGIQLDNSDYWLLVFDFESYTERANKNFTDNYFSNVERSPVALAVGDWVVLNDVLYKVIAAIAVNDVFDIGTNIIHFTIEQFLKDFVTSVNQTLYNYSITIQQYKNDIDASELAYRQQLAQDIAQTTASLQAQLDAAISGATVDSEVINARIGQDNITYPTLGDAIRTQVEKLDLTFLAKTLINKVVCAKNGQYSLPDYININDKFIDPGTGAQGSSAGAKCGFIPVFVAGHYYLKQRSTDFGSAQKYIPCFNAKKQYVKSIEGTVENSNFVSFDLTETDLENIVFVGASTFNNIIPTLWVRNTLPAVADYVEPRFEFVNSDLFSYRGYTQNNASLKDYITNGWYTLGTGSTDLPANYSGNTGFLLVFYPGVNYNIAVQILVSPSTSPQMYYRYVSESGLTYTDWFEVATGTQLSSILSKLNSNVKFLQDSGIVALSGNILDYDNLDWLSGGIDYEGGALAGSYYHAFIPIKGPGHYSKICDRWNFGNNEIYIGCYDVNKNYIESITNTTASGIQIDFDITNPNVRYITTNILATPSIIPKLFYEATATRDNYALGCNWGVSSDPLYKKVVYSDGDSIADGGSDLPYDRHGYFGRLKINYQVTGSNYAVGGGTITAETYYLDSTPRHWISRSIDTIYSDHPDLDMLLLEGGTNDADTLGGYHPEATPPDIPVRFGTWDPDDFSGSYDDTTFCGACDTLFYKASSYYPHSKIAYIIPMQMGTDTGTIKNRRAYFDVAKEIAKKWHIPVIDLWEIAGADARLLAYYDPDKTAAENRAAKKLYADGQHPTSYGYDRFQNIIEMWLKTI